MILQSRENKQNGIHYEINLDAAPIGVGGMGQVFAGVMVNERTGVKRNVAVKFLFDDLPANVVERAKRESSIRIQNENLIEMIDFVSIETMSESGPVEHYHVVSELLDGVMLHDILYGKVTGPNGRPNSYAEELYLMSKNDVIGFTTKMVRSVLSGLMALHDKGYVHRDVDPSNIMVCADGRIKLIDFGIAKKIEVSTGHQLTVAGKFMGKASYAAPELAIGDTDHQDSRTDIYAVGIMMFQFLTGRLPFEGPANEVLEKQRLEKVPVKAIGNKSLSKIVEKATAKLQKDRYQSAAEFRVAIEQFEASGVSKQLKTVSGVQKPKKEKKLRKKIDWKGIWDKCRRPLLITVSTAAAVCALFYAVSFSSKAIHSAAEKRRLLAEEQERLKQEKIAERIAQIKDDFIDSDDVSAVLVDSLSGFKIPSAAFYIARADSLLALGDEPSVDKAVSLYERVASKRFKSSTKAHYALSRIWFNRAASAKGDEAAEFKRRAHGYNVSASELDPDDYHVLYELGEDYLIGITRTGEDNRNIDSAKEAYQKGLALAESKGDEAYVEKFNSRLKRLGIK